MTALTPPLPQNFHFSQTSLQDFVDCPRRFELRYLHNLRYPSVEAEPIAEHEAHMRLGERFHRLVHQHLSGVPDSVLETTLDDARLQEWWARYMRDGVSLIPPRRQAEITLFTVLEGYRLLAKYDVLGFRDHADGTPECIIIDWKTSLHRPKRATLAGRLQTRVYPFVAVRTASILNEGNPFPPEKLSMVYWFAQEQQPVESFHYSAEQYALDYEMLSELLRDLRVRRSYPLTDDERLCRFCRYRSLCGRGTTAGNVSELSEDTSPDLEVVTLEDLSTLFTDFDQIAEVEF